MTEKISDNVDVDDSEETKIAPVKRLCNEVQLFDLCELEQCGHKQGLYCTSNELLSRFEAISEDDESLPAQNFISDDLDDENGTDDELDDVYYDEYDDESFDEDE